MTGGPGVSNLATISLHGLPGSDQRTTQNGVTWATMAGPNTPALPNMASIQEVVLDTSTASVDLAEGGIRINK